MTIQFKQASLICLVLAVLVLLLLGQRWQPRRPSRPDSRKGVPSNPPVPGRPGRSHDPRPSRKSPFDQNTQTIIQGLNEEAVTHAREAYDRTKAQFASARGNTSPLRERMAAHQPA